MTSTDTDSTTARRDLLLMLLMLLSRFERGAITDRERPLLRPLVEAEMATLDQLDTRDAPSWEALAEAVKVRKSEEAAHEEHRRSLAVILDKPHDANWLAVTRAATQTVAGRQTWKTMAKEIEAERDRLLRCIAKVRAELDRYGEVGDWADGLPAFFASLRRDIESWLPEPHACPDREPCPTPGHDAPAPVTP